MLTLLLLTVLSCIGFVGASKQIPSVPHVSGEISPATKGSQAPYPTGMVRSPYFSSFLLSQLKLLIVSDEHEQSLVIQHFAVVHSA